LLRERPELLKLLRSDDHSPGKFWSFPPSNRALKSSGFPDPQEFIIGFTCVQARKKTIGSFRIEAPVFPEGRVKPADHRVHLNLDTTTSFYSDSPNSRPNSADRTVTPERRKPFLLGENSPQKSLTLERRRELEALKEPLSQSPKLYSRVKPEYAAAPVEVRSPRSKAERLPPKASFSPRPAPRTDTYLTTIEASLRRIKGALAKTETTSRSINRHSPSPSAASRTQAIGRHSPYQRRPTTASSTSPLRMKDPESVVLNILKQQRRQVTTMVRQSITSPRRSPLSTAQPQRTMAGKYTDRPIFKV
jgi:hypothetical protein